MPVDFKGMKYVDESDDLAAQFNAEYPELHRKIMDADIGKKFVINLGPNATKEEAYHIRRTYYSTHNKERTGFSISSQLVEAEFDADDGSFDEGDVLIIMKKHKYPATA